jgi:hypothetical protein
VQILTRDNSGPQSPVASTFLVAIQGLPVGGGMIISTAMVQMVVSHEYIGITTQMAVTARNLGRAVGTVVYVAIFSGRLKHNIVKNVAVPLATSGVAPASFSGVLGALTGAAPSSLLASLTPAQLAIGMEGIRRSFAHAFRIVFLCSIPFSVVGTIAACLTEDVDHLMTNVVEMRLDEGANLRGELNTGERHISLPSRNRKGTSVISCQKW